jgi:hypothetical protein
VIRSPKRGFKYGPHGAICQETASSNSELGLTINSARFCWSCSPSDVHLTYLNVIREYALKDGASGNVVVKALHYKPEGRGFVTP